MALQFYIVIVLEDVQPPLKLILTVLFPLSHDGLWNQGAKATSGCDKTLMILVNQLFINPWIFAVQSLNVSKRGQFYEVFIPDIIFCQQDLMVPGVLFFL